MGQSGHLPSLPPSCWHFLPLFFFFFFFSLLLSSPSSPSSSHLLNPFSHPTWISTIPTLQYLPKIGKFSRFSRLALHHQCKSFIHPFLNIDTIMTSNAYFGQQWSPSWSFPILVPIATMSAELTKVDSAIAGLSITPKGEKEADKTAKKTHRRHSSQSEGVWNIKDLGKLPPSGTQRTCHLSMDCAN